MTQAQFKERIALLASTLLGDFCPLPTHRVLSDEEVNTMADNALTLAVVLYEKMRLDGIVEITDAETAQGAAHPYFGRKGK